KSSSTPAVAATAPRRARPGPMVDGLPWVITAARRTGSANCFVDPAIDVVRVASVIVLHEVEEELSVALRAGQPGVYDARDARAPRGGLARALVQHAPVDGRIPHDALAALLPPALELGLDEHESPPARRGEVEGRRQHFADGDERDVADDQVGRVGQLV